MVEPDWYTRPLTPISSDWSLIFQAQAPYLNTRPSPGLHTEPSGTPLFVPFPIPSVTQHTLTEHLPAVGSGVTKPVWVLYHIAEDYFMPSFLPSKLPYLLPSPSSSLLSADDLASCFIGQMEVCPLSTTKCFWSRGQHALLPPCIRIEDVSLLSDETSPTIWAVDPIPSCLGSFSSFTIINPFMESFLLD